MDNIIDPEVANALRGLDVRELRVQDLRELARILGVSSSGNKDALTLRLAPLLQSINGMYHSHHNNPYTITLHPNSVPHTLVSDTGTVVLGRTYPAAPWVLTKEEINLVDTRCKNLVLPPNCAAFCTTKAGIFKDKSSFWRMSSKLQVFMMLPVLFMGTGTTLYEPLTKLAHAIVLLTGRVISERFRRTHGYGTCINHVFTADVELCKELVPEALSEFERATLPSSHKSHVHQIVHYPKCVDLLGSLSGQWMFGDERRNKVITPCPPYLYSQLNCR